MSSSMCGGDIYMVLTEGGPTLQSAAYKFRLECVYYPGTGLKSAEGYTAVFIEVLPLCNALTSSRDHNCLHSFNSYAEIFSQSFQF
jgi:hypothetical protein